MNPRRGRRPPAKCRSLLRGHQLELVDPARHLGAPLRAVGVGQKLAARALRHGVPKKGMATNAPGRPRRSSCAMVGCACLALAVGLSGWSCDHWARSTPDDSSVPGTVSALSTTYKTSS